MSEQLHKYLQQAIDTLPPNAQLLIDIVGIEAAAVLIEKHGGKDLALYERGGSKQSLDESVGLPVADALAQHFGRAPIAVPRCAALLRAVRNASIHKMFDALTAHSMSGRLAIHKIVDEFRITERQVHRILKTVSVVSSA